MQKLKILILVIFFISQSLFSEPIKEKAVNQVCENKKDDEITKEIINSFAIVIKNFGKIITDPKNPVTVTESLADMISQMLNIVSTMKKNSTHKMLTEKDDITKLLNSMDADSLDKLMQICYEQPLKIQQNINY